MKKKKNHHGENVVSVNVEKSKVMKTQRMNAVSSQYALLLKSLSNTIKQRTDQLINLIIKN